MAYTVNEDGSITSSIAERQEAKQPKVNGKSKSNSKEGNRR